MFLHINVPGGFLWISILLKVVELVFIFVAVEESLELFWIPVWLPRSALKKFNITIWARANTLEIMILILFPLYFIQILFWQIPRSFYFCFSKESNLRSLLGLNNRIISALSCDCSIIFAFQRKIWGCSVRSYFIFD